jgi:hypothetical protein
LQGEQAYNELQAIHQAMIGFGVQKFLLYDERVLLPQKFRLAGERSLQGLDRAATQMLLTGDFVVRRGLKTLECYSCGRNRIGLLQ